MIHSSISSNPISHYFTWKDLTIEPYRKAGEYFDKFLDTIFTSPLSTKDRFINGFKYAGLTTLFAFPVINIICRIVQVILFHSDEASTHHHEEHHDTSASQAPQKTKTKRKINAAILETLQDQTKDDEKMKQSINSLSILANQIRIGKGKVHLEHCYDLHEIHNHLTRLARYIGTYQPDNKEACLEFFKGMENALLYFPNGIIHHMNLSRERFLLDYPSHTFQVVTTLSNHLTEQEVEEIEAIEKESFSNPLSKRSIRNFARTEGNALILAKVENQIVGALMYNDGYISSVARRADAVMGVGNSLFQRLKEHLKEAPPERTRLEVRVSNVAAISLYQRFGFEIKSCRRNYYSYPTEDAHVMTANGTLTNPV